MKLRGPELTFLFLAAAIAAGTPTVGAAPDAGAAPESSVASNKPELALRIGHVAPVVCAAVSPDGRWIVTGSKDRTARVWDAHASALLFVLVGHTAPVVAVAFSADGSSILTGSQDGAIRRWDTESGALVNTVVGPEAGPIAVAFSPDLKKVASSGADKTVVIWDPATGEALHKLVGITAPVSALAFSHDGSLLATGGQDGRMKTWDTGDGSLQRTLAAHAMPVHGLAFAAARPLLATASEDGMFTIWNVETGTRLQEVAVNPVGDRVSAVAFSPDGTLLATGGVGGQKTWETLRLWNVNTGQLAHACAARQAPALALAFAPDGKTLAVGSRDNTINLWDPMTAALKRRLGRTDRVAGLAASPDGTMLASANGDGAVRLWDAHSGELLRILTGPAGMVNAVAFSTDGAWVASGGEDGKVRLWDARTGALKRTLAGNAGPVNGVAFSPDGTRVACGAGEWEPGKVLVWNTATGALVRTLSDDAGQVNAVAFSPDGAQIASGSGNWGGGEIRIYDLKSGDMKMRAYSRAVHAIAFSHDGKILASGSAILNDQSEPTGDEVQIWNARTGERQLTLATPVPDGWMNALAFSADDKVLAGGSSSGSITVWNPHDGSKQQTITGHLGAVRALTYLPRSGMLASGSLDNTIRLWNGATGDPLAALVALPPQGQEPAGTDWIALLPQGYYDSSPGAGRYIQWRIGRDLFPVEAYENRFRRPDLVRRALSEQAVAETPDSQQFAAGQAVPPVVALTAPAGEQPVTGDNVEIAFTATSADKIARVQVLVDGRDTGAKPLTIGARPLTIGARPLTIGARPLTIGARPLTIGARPLTIGARAVPVDHQWLQEYRVQAPLPGGEPTTALSVIVTDEKGLEGREDLDLRRTAAPAAQGKLYVLAVGVSQYQNPHFNLKYAAADASSFAQLWEKSTAGLYTGVQSTVLTDEKATVAGVRAALAQLTTAGEDDSVAILLSGHGIQTPEGGFYFATHEIDPSTAAKVAETALPWEDLRNTLASLKARRVYLFLDACHSGNALGGQQAENERLAEVLARRAGVLVFASSRGSEYSYEDDTLGHGAFTTGIMEGVGQGKANFEVAGQRSKIITAEDLLAYLRHRVPQLTQNRQTPTCPLLLDFGDSYPLATAP